MAKKSTSSPAASTATTGYFADVTYTGVKSFWTALGRNGGVRAAKAVDGVTDATANGANHSIRVFGTEDAVADAALEAMWTEAAGAFSTWKQNDAKYIAANKAANAADAKRFALEKDFLREFAAKA